MTANLPAPKPTSLVVIFLTIAALVFMVVVMAVTLLTFILPESYASTARIKVGRPGRESASPTLDYDPILANTEAEIIQSEVTLGKVVEQLNLNTEWGRKYANGEKLKSSESASILLGRLEVKPVANTTLISVRVFSEDRDESARIANAVVTAYVEQSSTLSPGLAVQVVDRAIPGLRPVRPNKPLNITLGVILGFLLGGGCGGLVTALTANHRARRHHGTPPLPDAGLKPLH